MMIWGDTMKVLCGLFAALLMLALPASAQQTPNRGQPTTSAAEKLVVSATQPVSRSFNSRTDHLRVMLRLSSADGGVLPYMTEGDLLVVNGWSAFTASSASCKLNPDRLTGAPMTSRTRMAGADPTRWTVEGSRPAIVTADLWCDGVVPAGEFLTIQARFFVLVGGRWQQADYVFENVQVAARRAN